MKILLLTLFLYLSFFAACETYAGNNFLNVSWPAPSGSYNKVVLTNLQENVAGANSICNAATAGLLYYNTSTNALEICTKNGGSVKVAFPELCFNRFWNPTNPNQPCNEQNNNGFSGCPNNYTRASSAPGTYLLDSFSPDPNDSPNYYVCSTACCGDRSTVLPPHL